MKYSLFKQQAIAQLSALYDAEETAAILKNLLDYYGINKDTEIIEDNLVSVIKSAVSRLLYHEPLQYILQQAWFYNLPLYVNEQVLIPRPETEELVHLLLQQNSLQPFLKILDIGTGSGCIPIVIKKNRPSWQVDALDISDGALTVAKKNAETHNTSINFIHGDILKPQFANEHQYDIIVSNPPYIMPNEKDSMNPNVWKYEPSTALFVTDNNPLQFYKAIMQFAKHQLKPQGNLFFETNAAYAKDVMNLLIQNTYEGVTLLQDMHGNNRIVVGQKVK